MDVCRGRPGPCDASFSSHDLHSPHTVDPAEATSEKMPSNEGLDKPLVGALDLGRKSPSVATSVPSTPSTACGSAYSAVTPAASFDPASAWSQSSGGNTLKDSPAFSTSSTATELDEGSTQLELSANQQVDASAPNVEQFNNNLETPGWGGGETAYEDVIQEGSSCQSRRGKRPREQTLRSHHLQHIKQDSGPSFTPISDTQRSNEASPQSLPGDRVNHRRKDCLERSQYPRLDGHPTPGAGPRSHRNQLSNLGTKDSMRYGGGITPGGMFYGAMGSPQISWRESEQESTANVRPRDCIDSDGGGKAGSCLGQIQESVADSPHPIDQYDGDRMAVDGTERKPSPRGDNHGTTFPRFHKSSPGKKSGWIGGGGHSNQTSLEPPLPAVTCGDKIGRSDQESIDKPVLVDGRTEEAAALREAGVTGDEEFKELMPKLIRARLWRWGPNITRLSNDYWILRIGAVAKTAKLGVDKFAERKNVVQYVRGVLGLADVTTLDSKDGHSEEGKGRKEIAADEESGDREVGSDRKQPKDEEQEDEKELKAATELKQPKPSMSTPQGRALQAALEALNPSNAPDVLQQRTTEFNQVLRFVTNSVAKASGGSLYLCGVPGTGKTQTMAHVQAKIHQKYSKGEIPAPAFHAFTGTEFTTPGAMHGALWLAVTGAKGVEESIDIEKKLTNKLKYWQKAPTLTSPMLVVVLDEIDQLMTQNRQVLRKLFEWADAPKSRLVLVGLANSLDFDINFSDLKKAPQRLLFQSYTPEDLASILTERVGATVHHSAIQFCSKKAAATTGDARRAINICREAVVLAEQELHDKLAAAASEDEREQVGQGNGDNLVTIRHMARAVAAGNAAKYAGAIAGLSFHAKIVLAVAAATVGHVSNCRGRGRGNAGRCARLTQGDLQEKCMGAWGRLQTGGGPSQVEFTGIIDLLAASGLLALKSKQQTGGRARELVLRIDFADLEAALGDQPFFKTVTGEFN